MQKFDREASTWDQNPLKTKLASDIAQAMLDELKPGRNDDLLEFGCGTGLVTLKLQPVVRSVLGVDNSTGMLRELSAKIADRGLNNITTKSIDLEKGEVLAGDFDIAVSSMTFHHIRDFAPLLRQIFAALRPGGRLGIADLDLDDGQFHDNNEGVHHAGFDRTAFRRQAEEAGFTEVRFRIAAEVVKPIFISQNRIFTVFLMSAKKPA